MTPLIRFIIVSSVGLGTTLTFLSSHWLIAWIGLEVNSLAFLPLMAQHNHPRSAEATTKYFLIQSAASGMLMFATSFNAWMLIQWDITQIENPIANCMLMMALALKLGLAPFHFWPAEIVQGLDLKTGLILITWQKLAPLALLIQMSHAADPRILTALAAGSALAAAWAGLNQTQLRKILAYSSTTHLAWMIIIIQYTPEIAIFALLIYIASTMAAFFTLMESSSTKIITLTLTWSKNTVVVVMLTLILLSLAGLPPFTGFSPKMFVLEEMTKQEMSMPAALLLMSSLISLYFYGRMCYHSTITLFPTPTKRQISWRRKPKQDKITMSVTTMVATILLPLTPTILMLVHLYST